MKSFLSSVKSFLLGDDGLGASDGSFDHDAYHRDDPERGPSNTSQEAQYYSLGHLRYLCFNGAPSWMCKATGIILTFVQCRFLHGQLVAFVMELVRQQGGEDDALSAKKAALVVDSMTFRQGADTGESLSAEDMVDVLKRMAQLLVWSDQHEYKAGRMVFASASSAQHRMTDSPKRRSSKPPPLPDIQDNKAILPANKIMPTQRTLLE